MPSTCYLLCRWQSISVILFCSSNRAEKLPSRPGFEVPRPARVLSPSCQQALWPIQWSSPLSHRDSHMNRNCHTWKMLIECTKQVGSFRSTVWVLGGLLKNTFKMQPCSTCTEKTLILIESHIIHRRVVVRAASQLVTRSTRQATGKMRICGHADLRIEQRVKCGSECGRKSANYPPARVAYWPSQRVKCGFECGHCVLLKQCNLF